MKIVDAFTSPLLSSEGIVHGFFGRQGGVSQGYFHSLNTGFGKQDPNPNVFENYRRIAHYFHCDLSSIAILKQVHGADVIEINAPSPSLHNPEVGDALITTSKNILLGIRTADCAPVLLYDPTIPIIAAVHAGWRGILADIILNTLEKMSSMGARSRSIRAVIGPCISAASYEAGPELKNHPKSPHFLVPHHNMICFDLEKAIKSQLNTFKVVQIDTIRYDTLSNPNLFFSYRRSTHQKNTHFGVQFSGIILK